MIDFLFGLIVGGLLTWAFLHFRANPAKAVSDLTSIEQRIALMISDAMANALAELKNAVEAKVAAATGPAADAAAAAKDAEDVQAVQDFTAQISAT